MVNQQLRPSTDYIFIAQARLRTRSAHVRPTDLGLKRSRYQISSRVTISFCYPVHLARSPAQSPPHDALLSIQWSVQLMERSDNTLQAVRLNQLTVTCPATRSVLIRFPTLAYFFAYEPRASSRATQHIVLKTQVGSHSKLILTNSIHQIEDYEQLLKCASPSSYAHADVAHQHSPIPII
ncbi:hypothetical protein F511_14770 [Dorcoceras hygrometricum]|uniref:Uncharacterized protein n=1 Tax=Dorcoceras hygrometricum TaxID=472368 RepID=A0A2Z7DKD8_9LAMI|nr:hypothetical protein F511_14770 [Dorcoceras hygrometricum]